MITAIIAAAGSGSRFESDTPKQFLEVHGKPVIIHTLERFEVCPDIDHIVVVVAEREMEDVEHLISDHNINKPTTVAAGGNSRAHSVANGLNAVDPQTSIVVVHDGARPLVSPQEITATIRQAERTGAACLVTAVTDTIKTVENGVITGTIDRSKLRRALTPQTFRIEVLQRAFAAADLDDSITDECSMVEKIGIAVSAVDGSSKNIKITHREDMIVAEAFLRGQ